MTSAEEAVLKKKWFYKFNLPSGKITQLYIDEDLSKIHETREEMMFSVLSESFNNTWNNITCMDMACHQGYYATRLAAKGCKNVIGIDARKENIDDANLINKVYGYDNLSFVEQNIFDIDINKTGQFDVVIVFGLMYHLENPIEALRIARKLTKKICLIETQTAPNISGIIDWGTNVSKRKIFGSFSIIDETYANSINNREANLTNISLVPSQEALLYLMNKLNFNKIQLLNFPENAYEQFHHGNRIMLAGYVN